MTGKTGRRWGWWALLVYLILLVASNVVRSAHADPPPSDGRVTQSLTERSAGDAVRIAFWDWPATERPSGDPVLLLHGSPGSGSVFRGLGPRVAARHRAIAPDLPGFGGSTRNMDDYSIRTHADLTLQLLDSLGIDALHVVGFSMGGGVGLEMYRKDPERIRSLTLLSAIGVQEHELLGDYHLNHAIHGLQLFGIWALTELVPHFGAFDSGFFGRSYARNFYDTDQRPLRDILQRFQPPMLVLHSDGDDLVPPGAAMEHHRIVPQSELEMLAGNHFMTFQRPGDLAPILLDFMSRVERGDALSRSQAAPERIAAAQVPFDPASMPPAYGFALVITLALIAAATFVSEDLTCIGTGLLIARGSVPWIPGILACLIGIWIGDLLLYAAGRFIGRPVVRVAPMKWFIRKDDLDRSCRWFTKRSGPLVLWGRFIPGTRLPTYVAAGVVHLSFVLFAFWALVAGILWTPLLVGGSALFGAAAASWIGAFQDRALWWLLGTAATALLALRVLLPLTTWRGRAMWSARVSRLVQWEFWPPWLFYPPVVVYVLWLAVRHRSLTVFTAANPGIPDGGFVGESKFAILGELADSRVARSYLVEADLNQQRRIVLASDHALSLGGFPVVVKPDVGERGAGVTIARSEAELVDRVASDATTLLVQEYVPGVELGVFYYRIPGDATGHILSVTEKHSPSVTGDGTTSTRDLILSDRRLRHQRAVFARRLGDAVDQVPALGETVGLGELGNHCLGSAFGDGRHLVTPVLAEGIFQVSELVDEHLGGFYFGRYDIRGESLRALQSGTFKVIELNGASAEATHIYDTDIGLAEAYRTLFQQWALAFRIGEANKEDGAQPTSLPALLSGLVKHFRPGGKRWTRA
ncbi:MAG: alpha/beta fold hydrolase [Longimicrobiales bacterium]